MSVCSNIQKPVRNIIIVLLLCIGSIIYMFSTELLFIENSHNPFINHSTSRILVTKHDQLNKSRARARFETYKRNKKVTRFSIKKHINNTNNIVKRKEIRPEQVRKHQRLKTQYSNSRAVCGSLPRQIWSMVHHKTGHDLSWGISGVLKKGCRRKVNMITELSIKKFLAGCHPNVCVYMHWVRHPLNTIISGYYYHLKTDEEWVYNWTIKTSINTAIDMKTDLLYMDVINNNVDDTNKYDKYRKEIVVKVPGIMKRKHNQWDYKRQKLNKLTTCFDVGSETGVLYKYIGEFMGNYINNNMSYILMRNMDMTLQEFYKQLHGLDYRIGLFWEFVRYFKCEWASIYVLQKIGYKYWNNLVEYDIDEFTHGKFDYNMNKLLDQLGVIDGTGLNINVTQQRMYLLSSLNKLDVTKSKEADVNMHVTLNEYDIEQVTRDLLGLDVEICKLIKSMTVLLKFEWDYDTYC